MITLYSGTPGSGKSFHAVALVLRILNSGRYVIANFALSFTPKQLKKGFAERFFYYPNEEITINNLIMFAFDHGILDHPKESQILCLIDEAGGRFNCRDFGKSDRREWIDFFSQHRKLGYDFVLVAQNDRMLDRQIRGYIETEIKHRKVNNFGPFWFIPWPIFICVEWWYTARQRVGSEFLLYRKKVSERYDSMKMFSGFRLSEEMLKKIEEKRTGIKQEVNHSLDVNIDAIFNESTEE